MIQKILNKLQNGAPLTPDEIVHLLTRRDRGSLARIFSAARKTREKYFGPKIFSYGFIYFSTYCRNDCAFCYCRRSNPLPRRYRKSAAEILLHAASLERSGVNLIDLTMGEDPFYIARPERLAKLVRAVKKETGLPVMMSPGVVGGEGLEAVAAAGADWLALYQETHNRPLFAKRRLGQDFDARMALKRRARELGLLVEEGVMTGIGETAADRARSFAAMRELGARQVRSMRFVPQAGTPMAGEAAGGAAAELLDIAVLRLLFPDRLIPASLDVDGLTGLAARLRAGANVITSLIPPAAGLMGVSRPEKDIRSGRRTLAAAKPVLEKSGLRAATQREYQDFLDRARAGRKAAAG
ncbi:MAG: methylornithine synthase PylB [Gracilibacteraceae bacterium]|jgi:methylornithine synthase|nr:methylornithine synthase PylB [Gracilibacteraceae bacterium]